MASSKFGFPAGVQPTPKICKAVNDSFRFVPVTFDTSLQFSLQASIDNLTFNILMNGNGEAIGVVPFQQWRGQLGDLVNGQAIVWIDYDIVHDTLKIEVGLFQGTISAGTWDTIIGPVNNELPIDTHLLTLMELDADNYVRIRVTR